MNVVVKSPEHEEDEEEEEENVQVVQEECLEAFSTNDYIMEPGVFNTLKRYWVTSESMALATIAPVAI